MQPPLDTISFTAGSTPLGPSRWPPDRGTPTFHVAFGKTVLPGKTDQPTKALWWGTKRRENGACCPPKRTPGSCLFRFTWNMVKRTVHLLDSVGKALRQEGKHFFLTDHFQALEV